MEVKSIIKKCEVCMVNATCLCFKCMSYYCDTCFKNAHDNEKRKSHKKEKIDYFVPFDVRCPEHELVPTNLFCIDDKGNLIKLIFFII